MSIPLNILILEDEPDLLDLYAHVLKRAGYTTSVANTVGDARRLLHANHYDLFISDMHLGSEQGSDLLREHRARLRAHGTEVIVVSAQTQYRSICKDLGYSLFLVKPVAMKELLGVLQQAVQNRDVDAPFAVTD